MNNRMPISGSLLLRTTLLFLLTSFSVLPLFSQETKVVRDLNLWTGIELEKSIGKKWTFSVQEEIRFKQDITKINNFFTQASIDYRISKNFSLGGNYRYTRNQGSDGTYENRSRYSADLKYRENLGEFSIYYRLRYQKEIESMDIFSNTLPYEKYVRNKLEARYNGLRKLTPYCSAELFQLHLLNEFPEFNQLRLSAGLIYEPGKNGKTDLGYMIDRELSNYLPYTIFIIKLNYTYSF